jgi:S1-C subfamily serine protease
MKRALLFFMVLSPFPAACAIRADSKTENDVRRAVVRIFASQRFPDLVKPWNKRTPQEVTGSGVVIPGQRVLTSGHLILYSKQIYVQPYESSDKFPATVERIAPGLDLALLKVDDKAFFEKQPCLPLSAPLPEVKDPVSVYGYPIGGSSLAITKGIVSRIGMGGLRYKEYALQIQIDAALNPGNSGGPATVNDRMIGLVFGHFPEGQNIGYLIPNEVIEEFLKSDPGVPFPGIAKILDELQPLENEALRAKLGLERSAAGILVRAPFSSDPSYPLRRGDIITRIGKHAIDNGGMVRIRDNLQLGFSYLVGKEAKNGKVRATILRHGTTSEVDLPVVYKPPTVLKDLQGDYPPYFVYGPLVFSRATGYFADFMLGQLSPSSPLVTRREDRPAFDGEEFVIVTALLPHKLSKGYSNPFGQVLSQINGTRIRNLRHLVETLSNSQDRYVEFEFAEKYVEVLVFDRRQVLESMEDILSDNGIPQQCSADLRALWQPKK